MKFEGNSVYRGLESQAISRLFPDNPSVSVFGGLLAHLWRLFRYHVRCYRSPGGVRAVNPGDYPLCRLRTVHRLKAQGPRSVTFRNMYGKNGEKTRSGQAADGDRNFTSR